MGHNLSVLLNYLNIFEIYPKRNLKPNGINSNDESERDVKHYNTRNNIIDTHTNLREWYQKHVIYKIILKVDKFQEGDSGWAVYAILRFKRKIKSYSIDVKLPQFIRKSTFVLSIQNLDHCFLWWIVAVLHPAPEKFNDIDFPINK